MKIRSFNFLLKHVQELSGQFLDAKGHYGGYLHRDLCWNLETIVLHLDICHRFSDLEIVLFGETRNS